MHRHEHGGRKRRAPRPSPQFVEPDGLAEHGLSRGDAKADDDARLYELCFRFQPGPACRNFRSGRFFVLPAFSLWLPLEVLHGIGDVDVATGNAAFSQSLVQHSPRGTDKGFSGQVFLIARLFADEQERRMDASFAKDGLSGMLVQVASGARG